MAVLKLAVAAMAMVASGAQAACVTRTEAEALATAVLPTVLDGVAGRCATLGAPMRDLPALATRYRPDAAAAWSGARDVMVRVMPEARMFAALDEAQARAMLSPIIADKLGEKLKAADCATVDRAAGALAPLPARNMATLLVTLLQTSGGRSKSIDICPEPAR